jgi:hypothetical protein
MAAEAAALAGATVDLFDARPSVGRKFLLAGRGGLNLTHAEPFARFVERYGPEAQRLRPLLEGFGPEALRAWTHALGIETFVGTSGRVFPTDFKAGPMLRRWVQRLHGRGVRFHVRHRWLGFGPDDSLAFDTPAGTLALAPQACVLALGGASWPQLGSDGAWVPWLRGRGIPVATLVPANCGFEVAWSTYLRDRHAGAPVKSVVGRARALDGTLQVQAGELVVTASGVEGGLVYALSRPLREALARDGHAFLELDLAPGRTLERLRAELSTSRGSRSLSQHLKRLAGIDGVKAALLHEFSSAEQRADPVRLATLIKALPIPLSAPRPIDEAISSAGGVALDALDDALMLKDLPGVFCAGEMIDWEAPTGGYLLTACLATGRQAGAAAAAWAAARGDRPPANAGHAR